MKEKETTACFESIYSSHRTAVFNFILKMTGDPVVTEDIVHDTFVSVFEKYENFRSESSLRTWIFAIAKNKSLKYFEKAKRSSFRDIGDLIESASDAGSVSRFSDTEKRDYIEQVKDGCLLGLLRCLSYYQRTAFILHVLHGFSADDTGEIIGKSSNAVRILVYRARTALKDFLCRNCSLYDRANPCRCENLISFSLKQGWIHDRRKGMTSVLIEQELEEFRDEVRLYKSMKDTDIPQSVNERIEKTLKSGDYLIFSAKKVK